MCRKRNPFALLMEMQTGAATVEDSMEFPQNTKKWNCISTPTIPLLVLYPKNPETPIQKNLCIPMIIACLLYTSDAADDWLVV